MGTVAQRNDSWLARMVSQETLVDGATLRMDCLMWKNA